MPIKMSKVNWDEVWEKWRRMPYVYFKDTIGVWHPANTKRVLLGPTGYLQLYALDTYDRHDFDWPEVFAGEVITEEEFTALYGTGMKFDKPYYPTVEENK